MKPTDPEFYILTQIYKTTHKKPTITEYSNRIRALDTNLPSKSKLIAKYGSARAVVNEFLQTYTQVYGVPDVPDYLLGSLAGRCNFVRRNETLLHLRYVTTDEEQIKAISTYLHNVSIQPMTKEGGTYEVRIQDYDLFMALEDMDFFKTVPFRPTVDFVRGYCDGHSAIRVYPSTGSTRGNTLVRMTVSGSLVPQIHDYLVVLGARNTSVIQEGPTLRMHINAMSLRQIRETLYPMGCVCNERKRAMIFHA